MTVLALISAWMLVVAAASGCASTTPPSATPGISPLPATRLATTPGAPPLPATQPSATAMSPIAASSTPSTMAVKVYFSRFTSNDVEFVPVERTVLRTPAAGRVAVEELLKGPTAEERTRGLDTSIPQGVRLLSLKVVDGVARADFDDALEFQVGGSARVMAIRRSITLTLLQFPTVQSVVISIEGRTEDILQP